MQPGNRVRWIVGGAMVILAALLMGACGGDIESEDDADATDQGEEVIWTDPPPYDDGGPEDIRPDDGGPEEIVQDEISPDSDEPDETDAEEPDGPPPVDCAAIAESITAAGLLAHLTELATIASDNGGDRSAGSAGWDASVQYVEDALEADGYTVTRSPIEFPYYELLANPVLERISPTARTYTFAPDDYAPVGDFQKVALSPPGDVTADVTAVDLTLGPGNDSTSGCEATDFTGFVAGTIALVQRGTCYFVEKALNAQAAGAAGVLLFNQGNTPDREGLMEGGVGMYALDPTNPDHGVTIPILMATYAVGDEIAGLIEGGSAVTLHMQVNTVFEVRESQNILAETAGGNADEVVMLGAHFDSVPSSPGINDNASGAAALLEIAHAVSTCDVTRKIRFAFWASEEWGLWGSITYVVDMPASDLDRIYAYLNADMIGSPNYAVFVYDGDGSAFGVPGPSGSAEIERFFVGDLELHGLSSGPVYFEGSDHFPFEMSGVACGGLFTGADERKTAEEASAFGGAAGESYDACYHEPCDDLTNVNMDIAEPLTLSLARAAQFFGVDGLSDPP